jgi:hypothetical protein
VKAGRTLLALLVLALGALPGVARAQRTFTSNDYAIDLVTGPLLGGGRIVGMAGAYSAIASGIDGAVFNPAGYAERYEKEIDWFAWDVTGGLWLGLVFKRNDFDNNGEASRQNAQTYQAMLGGRLQFSYFGTGLNWLGRLYQLRDVQGRNYDVTLQTYRTGAGYSFLNGGLVAGFTVSTYTLGISGEGAAQPVTFNGYGGEVGVLVRPARERYRLGFVARTPVTATLKNPEDAVESNGVRRALDLVLPEEVHVPWELSVGFAYQFGERRTNTPWRNTRQLRRDLLQQILNRTYVPADTYGEAPYQALPSDPRKALDVAMANYREAERRFRRHQPRRYVLLSADLIAYGKTSNGHGIEAFLNQTPERSGQKVSYGARIGVESEIWPDRVKVRGGTYLEPSRFRREHYRLHGTAGFDVRLFDIWRWSVRGTGTVDLAPRYFNWGIAFGLWW